MIPGVNRELDAEQARILDAFVSAGAMQVDPPVLQPAETLLDLYGEDIRARAFVTRDPLMGELMMRPDFTVPVVQTHIADGARPAKYAYSGKVFRTQESGDARPSEYDQVGFEVFGGDDPAKAEAEVFALMANTLAGLPLRAATGDIGLLMAAVQGLRTAERRKDALMRHIWRPKRFRALLDRFGGRAPVPTHRAALVAKYRDTGAVQSPAPMVGLRGSDEVQSRIEALVAEADTDPISSEELTIIDLLLDLSDKAPSALQTLRTMSQGMPSLVPAADRIEARLDAMSELGIDVGALDFEGSYGRTSMEYYDGFVFGFYAADLPGMPPVATGGRYDALTRALGGAEASPAVGGVIRPALVLEVAQ